MLRKTFHKVLLIAFAVFLLVSAFLISYWVFGRPLLKIGGQTVAVEIADSDKERALGLGGRKSLPANRGMLFIFEEKARHGIWMKDVGFPIDVIWLNGDKQIIHVEANMSPGSYPRVFYPDKPASYVVELPAGFINTHAVKEGDYVQW